MDGFVTWTAGYFSLLSDEVILMILDYLPATDLHSTLWTCTRLKDLCFEKKLWKGKIEPPDNRRSLEYAVTNIFDETFTQVNLVGGVVNPMNRGYRSSISPSLIQKLILKGQSLSQLHLINQKLDGKTFRLQDLPRSLKILDMTGSLVTGVDERSHYFKDIFLNLTQLEDLILSYCRWVSAHSLLAISKLPKLKKLSLRGCRTIGECMAYVSLSSQFGFNTLKVLDVTDTMVGSYEFTSFGGIATLEEFYFGQYDHYGDHHFTVISDLSLVRLRDSPTLRVLDMTGSRVTDASLEVLRTLPNIERIEAHFTHLTEAGIEDFHSRKPKCRINKIESVPLPPIIEDNRTTSQPFPNLSAAGTIEIIIHLGNHE